MRAHKEVKESARQKEVDLCVDRNLHMVENKFKENIMITGSCNFICTPYPQYNMVKINNSFQHVVDSSNVCDRYIKGVKTIISEKFKSAKLVYGSNVCLDYSYEIDE
jgi:hypothetical protein